MEDKFDIYEYNSISDELKKAFFLFCEESSISEPFNPSAVNMYDVDWGSKSHTLPYILEKTDRFKDSTGTFHILTINDKIVACAGVYRSDFDDKIAILGCRTWVHENFRHRILVREFLLPIQKEWALKNNCDILVLTFNDYNKNLIKTFQRLRLGEKVDRIKSRQEKHLFYHNLNVLDYPVIIKNTVQWVIYEKVNDRDFDWESIKA